MALEMWWNHFAPDQRTTALKRSEADFPALAPFFTPKIGAWIHADQPCLLGWPTGAASAPHALVPDPLSHG